MQSVGRPPASLIFPRNKGKYYVQITVPMEDRKMHKGQKQLRISTGTADKRIAERLLHEKAEELYARLDAAKPNKIKELEEQLH